MADIRKMYLKDVLPLLMNKVLRKGRSKEEFYTVILWFLDISKENLEELSSLTYEEFFSKVKISDSKLSKIKGKICGIRVEDIEDDVIHKARALDKIVDDLAKGKSVTKIIG